MKLSQIAGVAVIALTFSACGGSGSSDADNSRSSTRSSSSTSSPASSAPTFSASTSAASSAAASSSASHTPGAAPAWLDAGNDRYASKGATVSLSAAVHKSDASYTYLWTVISGSAVNLQNAATKSITFIAPDVSAPTQVLLKVTATDTSGHTLSDTVRINVNAENARIRCEAEDGTLHGVTITSANTGYSGSGYVTGFNNSNDVNVAWSLETTAGFYAIKIGYLSSADKGFNLWVDGHGSSGKLTGSPDFSETGAGRVWLDDGTHAISIGGGWGWYDIDYVDLIPLGTPPKPQQLSIQLSNPAATPAAQSLFQYFLDQYGDSTISGQQDLADSNKIEAKTGKRPAIYAFDLLNYSSLAVRMSGLPPSQTEDFISAVEANNQIASLIWHWHSPMHAKNQVNPCPDSSGDCWWNSFYTEHSDFDLAAALADTNSDEYKALISDIDAIAVQLKKVQTAGIPVLWRPLHEADGAWFWWGASGSESFKTLWRLMYDRLTNHHGLNNLIWVWTNETLDWYPGDDVVDIVGIDAYPDDKHDLLTAVWDKMFERFDDHKPIALTEFGGVPFIEAMQAQGVWWNYFASWGGELGPDKMTEQELNDIYKSDAVITADEVNITAP